MKAGTVYFLTSDTSLTATGDSSALSGRPGILKSETVDPDSASRDYPSNKDIQRNLSPDWILYTLIGILAILSWIRLVYNKKISNLFESAVNYQRAIQVYDDPGSVKTRIFLALNFIYAISGGLFLYLIMDEYHYHPAGLDGAGLFLASAAFIAGLMLSRIILLKITAFIFNRQALFNEYIFHTFIYNKITGIVIIPFVLAIAYSKGLAREIFIYAGFLAVGSVFILRIARLLMFIFKNVVLLFYLILYLCTLEILPMLVIVKLILSLA